jgi:hypothetical protein
MTDTGPGYNIEVHHPTPAPPAAGFGQTMMEILKDGSIPADKLEIVLRFQAENIERQQREAFNLRYAEMQPHIPQVNKNGLVELINRDGKYLGSYKFAKWEEMDRVLRPIISEWNFGLAFRSKEHPDRVWVQGELMYGGYSKFSEVLLPPDTGPGRNNLQAWGGAVSYGKRYTAEMLLNIVRKDADNDAIGPFGERRLDAFQIQELEQLLADTNTDKPRFLETMVSSVGDLKDVLARDYTRLVNVLHQKEQRMRGGEA